MARWPIFKFGKMPVSVIYKKRVTAMKLLTLHATRATQEEILPRRWLISYPESRNSSSKTEQEVYHQRRRGIGHLILIGLLDESALYGGSSDYGSYEALANLTVSIAGVTKYSNYKRTLDLETALHSAEFTANGATFQTYALYPSELKSPVLMLNHSQCSILHLSRPSLCLSCQLQQAATRHHIWPS